MKIFNGFIALTFAILAFSFSNVNAQSFSSAKSGRTIEQNVQRQILRLPQYEVFDNIGFSVNGGTVTLFGKVRNAINKDDAENRVEDIAGVTNVINKIEGQASCSNSKQKLLSPTSPTQVQALRCVIWWGGRWT